MHILDTDTLTHLHAGHQRVVQRLHELTDPQVGITIITKIELLRGRYDYMLKASTGTELLRAQALLARTEMLLGDLLIIAFNEEAAGRFDQLRQIRRRREIGRADLLIASIALAHQAILVTRNVRHFQLIPGLTVVNWVD
ncbi:MAG: twitching motility protein PilT [Candidatus Entotheonella gemina]|uniref:Twitching motility protein PilT n=1 Tax=Candidatus Entotheonella gemina TaxID=1429439 RepID=W4LA65_9BACT|nr:MAG: twitching motility protein PilT [Candidatus Entotheonella gemina]